MRLLKALLFLELCLGCFWVIPALTPGAGLTLLMVFSFSAPVHGLCMAIALWWLVMRPETRRLAAAALLAPVALFLLPWPLRAAFGAIELGSDALDSALWVALSMPLAVCVLLPRQVALYLPAGLWRSRGLNLVIVLMLGGMLAAVVALCLGLVLGALPLPQGDEMRSRRDLVVGLVLILPIACVLVPLPMSLFGWVGLFHPEGRSQQRLRIAQFALSAILLAIGLPLAGLIYVMAMGGPG